MTQHFNRILQWFWPVLFIAVILIAGCAIRAKDPKDQEAYHKKVKGFGHKVHTEAGAACKNCHVKAAKSPEAGMPDERLCVFCHQTVYDNQPVGEFYNREKWQRYYVINRTEYTEIKMPHQQHISAGVECDDCHGSIADSIRVVLEHIPKKERCFSCHIAWNTPDKCNLCHKEIRYDVPPSSHNNGNFQKTHGQIYREESVQPDKNLKAIPSCNRCHSKDHCINCHQNQAPENHNNQWRLIGHGVAAGIERNSCKTCHNTDFCDRCHEGTKPKNHVAFGWGNPNNQHCNSCHLPINSTNCGVCHKETPGHFEGPPGSHTGGWGNPVNKHCADCHSENSTCSVCHNGTPSHQDVPPSSHTGLWGSPRHNHCLRCHAPISASFTCKVCHDRVSEHLSEAPNIPDNIPHQSGFNCRICHFNGSQILIHSDNGLDCILCHK